MHRWIKLLIGIIALIFLLIGVFIGKNESLHMEEYHEHSSFSGIKQTDIVHGNSLSGILQDGQEIVILKDYYQNNPVNRDDLIIYNFHGNPDPIVKIVKGVPGDHFELKKDSAGLWNIVVNNTILTTSDGAPYAISRPNMLSLYVSSYKGVIPEDAYLILGNLKEWTLDSTRFGLVNKVDFVGKVER